tara:strand:- start:30095 stop:31228 length:1134 start_codon:yes stop_codon:yes gene_type:complete
MAIKAEVSFSLKDELFNQSTVTELAHALGKASPKFVKDRFIKGSLQAFPQLELKERIAHLVHMMAEQLPEDYPQSLRILEKALPAALDPKLEDDDFGRFIWVVPGEYVATYGCTKNRLKHSLKFLQYSTMRFSAENAIRPFLNEFPEATMTFVQKCAQSKNYHVRRLASEGIRPFLPWSPRVDLPVADVLSVLDQLHRDKTRYVTRSIANNLNDISKIAPELVLEQLKHWGRLGEQEPTELEWMTRHALRTLIKQDHKGALALLGYPVDPKVKLKQLDVPGSIRVGDALNFSFDLHSEVDQRLLIGFKLYYLKANGSHATKVFKVKDLAMVKGETTSCRKSQTFRPMTTRTLYPGEHKIEIVVNGRVIGRKKFLLEA